MTRMPYVFIIASCVCAGTLAIVLMGLPPPRRAGVGTADSSDFAFHPRLGAQLPLAAQLVDEYGRAVTLGDYFTKSPVILMLDYLQCTSLCGVTLRNVLDALHRLPLEAGRDYQVVTISIDPRDKPSDGFAARTKYIGLLDDRRAGSGIHFLTAAAPAEVREIAGAIGFSYRYDSVLDAYIHPAGFVIAAPDGMIGRYVEDTIISSRELVGALADAERKRTQPPITRLLLLCKLRAPTGWLAAPVLTALTVADIAAALMLMATFAAIWRRRA
jgi:protein SCO1/2